MKHLKVLTDRHFPYDIEPLNIDGIKAKRIKLNKKLPAALRPFQHVAALYKKSFSTDVILANRRSSLLLGLLYRVYKPKKVKLIGYEIIFNFKDNLRNQAVIKLWRIAVKKIDKLVVQSSSERKYLADIFSTSDKKFETIPFYTENASYIGPAEDGYIFAAGRMERDFVTLLQALEQNKLPAVIVADQSLREVLEPLKSAKVSIHYNIPKKQYLELLQKARLVVVPLFKGAAARGQVVILEAMKYGKPVLSAEVPGTIDYIKHGETGLLVEPENTAQMRSLLEQYFPNFEALVELGKKGFEVQRKQFSPPIFHQNYINTILRLSGKQEQSMELYANAKKLNSSPTVQL
jgi:glycosyltransferase involved in cell wall biosynthesis